jgi:DNA repair protein RecN (Recombination protein N)
VIEEIYIQDLGVIGESRLKFGSGLTVLTGETGAGKTMVLTALGLLLGERSDSGSIRRGQAQTFIEGRWWLKNPQQVAARLDDAGIQASDGELILNRTVTTEGRSRAAVMGKSVPVSLLNELSDQLVVVHGQSDQIRLKSSAAQREALDQFAGENLQNLLTDYRAAYAKFKSDQARLDELRSTLASREFEAEQIRTAVAELEQAQLQPGEDAVLAAKAERLTHIEELRIAAASAHQIISNDDFGSDDVIALVGQARRLLDQVSDHDEQLAETASELKELGSQLNEVAASLSRYVDGLDSDGPAELEQIQHRRALVNSLMRKYGPSLEEALDFYANSGSRLLDLDSSTEQIDRLAAALDHEFGALKALAAQISSLRAAAASELASAVTAELAALAMPGASLVVEIAPLAELSAHGADSISIQLSAYPGAEPRPLGKGASGGELSRIMLAIEVVLAKFEQAPTFIFDEVDAGVGGAAAIEVGRRLGQLAKQAQVIVVTHLAQVAAFANHHLKVLKSADGEFTNSSVVNLTEFDRVTELARMLSGLSDSEAAKSNALELLQIARAEQNRA